MRLFFSAVTTILMSVGAFAAPVIPRAALSEPGISPDGSEIAFVSGGDIWTMSARGGEARLLVSDPATESRPLYSPDGQRLAFVSDRTGNGDIYILDLASGDLRRLTFDDGSEQLDGWSRDGRWIYFDSYIQDISGSNDIFRVAVEGGTPMPISNDRYVNEYFAASSPDGSSLLVTADGMASAQWWRHGSAHIDQSEIWLVDPSTRRTRQVSPGNARDLWPMWSADGSRFFFISDRSGDENVWAAVPDESPVQLTKLTGGRVLWPSISADGNTIAIERDFGISVVDTRTGEVTALPVNLHGVAASAGSEYRQSTGDFSDLAVSPDGKKVAFIAHGEVFAASAKDGGEAVRVTTSPAPEANLQWAPDSLSLVFASERDGDWNLYLYTFPGGPETQLTRDAASDLHPTFSPDGEQIAYLRGGNELHTMDVASKKDRLIASARIDDDIPLQSPRPFVWSPDGKWIAFMSTGDRMFRNASVVRADGAGSAIPVSFLSNVFNATVSWSSDGTYLLFDTGQRTERGQVARVDLVPQTPKFRESEFRDLFQEETPKSVPPEDKAKVEEPAVSKRAGGQAAASVEIVPDGIRRRLELLPLDLDVEAERISPDGKHLLITATAVGQENLYLFPLDPLSKDPAVPKQLTSSTGRISDAQFSSDGKQVFYLNDGKIFSLPIEGGSAKPVPATASMTVDFAVERDQSFRQAWSWMRDFFHDPGMNGADWEQVRRDFEPRVAAARTSDELHRLFSLMVGELNASHLGSRSGARPDRSIGRIGLRFDRVEYEQSGRFHITEVVPLSPAAVTRKIPGGDYLLAIDGVSLNGRTNLASLLDHKVGKEVILTLASDAEGTHPREVAVQPVSLGTAKQLIYDEWVAANRARVDELSGGRLGYVHIPDMSYGSLLGLARDLDAQNQTREGVVVDVRNNNGGFINAYALDILSRRHYLNMTFRGYPTAPARTILGQRALERPTVLLTNRHSLSDAEDFAEGYRAMKLGKIVGEPTAGWIIYTTNIELLDGSIFRIPFITITTADGEPMELHPRPVDVPVANALGESWSGRDSQLERAVKELLSEIGAH